MKDLSEQSLVDVMNQLVDSATLISLKPTKLIVQPYMYKLALKVLRGSGWHYRNTKRWRYLIKRKARK